MERKMSGNIRNYCNNYFLEVELLHKLCIDWKKTSRGKGTQKGAVLSFPFFLIHRWMFSFRILTEFDGSKGFLCFKSVMEEIY